MNINMEDILSQMRGQTQATKVKVLVEKLDLFINRCIKERGYTCRILHQEIQRYLQIDGQQYNLTEDSIYGSILQRLAQRIHKGEK